MSGSESDPLRHGRALRRNRFSIIDLKTRQPQPMEPGDFLIRAEFTGLRIADLDRGTQIGLSDAARLTASPLPETIPCP